LSVIGGVTPGGEMSLHIQEKPINAWNVILFLTHLLRRFGKLLVIWDGSPIHRSDLVKLFIKQVGSRRLHTELFPAYAPDLNPAESLWQHLKHDELANVCCRDLRHLTHELQLGINRIRVRPPLIQAFFEERGLELEKAHHKKV
jgi:transposase